MKKLLIILLIFSCTITGGFIKTIEYDIQASNIDYHVEFDNSNNVFPNVKTKIVYPNKLIWHEQVEINTDEKQIIRLIIRFNVNGDAILKITESINGYKKVLKKESFENIKEGFIIISL